MQSYRPRLKAIRFTPVPQETIIPPCLRLIDRLILRPVTVKIAAVRAGVCEEETVELAAVTRKLQRVEVSK